MPLVSAKNLYKNFRMKGQPIAAVQDFTLDIFPGETVGLLGPSGCGKTTVGRLLVKLYEPDLGSVFFEEKNLSLLKGAPLRNIRARMQMVFQDPYASLNSRMRILDIVAEGLDIHGSLDNGARLHRVSELLDLVGLRQDTLKRYPHELSGGQCQRVGIARALATNPRFIVCDEPLSALDVSVQAQIVNLLKSLQRELKLTYLFISHDIAMVEYLSDRIAKMESGRLVSVDA